MALLGVLLRLVLPRALALVLLAASAYLVVVLAGIFVVAAAGPPAGDATLALLVGIPAAAVAALVAAALTEHFAEDAMAPAVVAIVILGLIGISVAPAAGDAVADARDRAERIADLEASGLTPYLPEIPGLRAGSGSTSLQGERIVGYSFRYERDPDDYRSPALSVEVDGEFADLPRLRHLRARDLPVPARGGLLRARPGRRRPVRRRGVRRRLPDRVVPRPGRPAARRRHGGQGARRRRAGGVVGRRRCGLTCLVRHRAGQIESRERLDRLDPEPAHRRRRGGPRRRAPGAQPALGADAPAAGQPAGPTRPAHPGHGRAHRARGHPRRAWASTPTRRPAGATPARWWRPWWSPAVERCARRPSRATCPATGSRPPRGAWPPWPTARPRARPCSRPRPSGTRPAPRSSSPC
ncbi:hypothetical protein G5V59_18205 [Nocardioides sp. W3-2-3]|nr:hypothetical protein [Nocardioides convexus]